MVKNKFSIIFVLAALIGHPLSGEESEKSVSDRQKLQDALEKRYNIKVIDKEQAGLVEEEENSQPVCPSLTHDEIHRVAFSLIPSSSEDDSESIIDEKSIAKLLSLKNHEQRQFALKTVFNGHVATGFGQAQALLTLSNPTTDLTKIRSRQQAINVLCADKLFADAAHKELNAIALAEKKSLLPFQSEKSVLKKGGDLPFHFFYSGTSIGEYLDKIPLARDVIVLHSILMPVIYGSFAVKSGLDAKDSLFSEENTARIVKNGVLWESSKHSTAMSLGIISVMDSGSSLQNSLSKVNPYRGMMNETQKHFNALHNLSALVNKNEQLLTQLPELQPLADFNDSTKRSEDLNYLISIFDSYNFEGEDSLLSRKGPVLAGKVLIDAVKKELVPTFVAAGKLDMYVALAKMYQGDQSQQVCYCMPEFVENSPTPLIDAHNFWNPYVSAQKAVPNTIKFDQTRPNGIITGPNTGGKSTAMRGLMFNALMAQSFGIAPSEKLTMTPFAKLGCLMNTSDDIANAASLFKAEAMNANDILSTAQNLKKDEFGLFILDEIFSSTSPEAGELATRRYAKKLSDQRNAINVIATHFKDAADHRNNPNSRYTYFQMEMKRNDDGSLKRTYKLKQGESKKNIAFDVIKEVGLNI